MLDLARLTGFLVSIAMLSLIVGFGVCGGGGSPPEARGCSSPIAPSFVTEIEVGSATGDFEPGARATPMVGGQGSDMLGYRVAVRSTTPVTCISVTPTWNLSVTPSGEWYATDPIWRIVRGSTLDVEVDSYGVHIERTMSASPLDAGSSTVDAAP
jgi:hypothetical protein